MICPEDITARVVLGSGEIVEYRLLERKDAKPFGDYLLGLSSETGARFGPHRLTMEEADSICERLNYVDTLPLIGLVTKEESIKIIAYFILQLGVDSGEMNRYAAYGIRLDDKLDCVFAPSITDCYQNLGLGSLLIEPTMAIARAMGRKRMLLLGGTQASNHHAIHFYRKCGFRQVGEFEHKGQNIDMIADLN